MRKAGKTNDFGRGKIFGKFCKLLRIIIKKQNNPHDTDENRKPV